LISSHRSILAKSMHVLECVSWIKMEFKSYYTAHCSSFNSCIGPENGIMIKKQWYISKKRYSKSTFFSF
jgi:cytosine/uracil/thiamine/allantoin permease